MKEAGIVLSGAQMDEEIILLLALMAVIFGGTLIINWIFWGIVGSL
tara:strand:- start:117 stop:254 length:138 start_codon:yes stop_codon:yes gene_type:complete